MQKINKNGFSQCAGAYIERLRKEGRYSTAHVYKNALFSFSKFCGTLNISFRQVTRECLRCYGQHLYESGLKLNTISTYMRMLRSIYNRGVEAGSAPYVPRLFHDVYTGVDIRQKKALSVTELHKLLYEDPKSERLRRTQTIAALMFQFCGMSFADLAHLEKSALDRNVLQYNRIKTKTPMSLEILESAKEMMNQLRSNKPALPDCPDYLFDILHGDKKRKDEKAYKEILLQELQNVFLKFIEVSRGGRAFTSLVFGMGQMSEEGVTKKIAQQISMIAFHAPHLLHMEKEFALLQEAALEAFRQVYPNREHFLKK